MRLISHEVIALAGYVACHERGELNLSFPCVKFVQVEFFNRGKKFAKIILSQGLVAQMYSFGISCALITSLGEIDSHPQPRLSTFFSSVYLLPLLCFVRVFKMSSFV